MLVQVAFNGDPISSAARATLARVRAVPPPAGAHVLVGGFTAFLVDQLHSIGHVLPWMLGVMIVAMLVLLFLAFGSFVLPFKAVAMNALSIGASFGAVTWVFQSGHLSNLFGFSKLGYLDATDPILMLAVVFGLSMDYEVFLLSRIREEWDANRHGGQWRIGRGPQPARGRARAPAQRPHHHQRRAAAGDRGRRVRHLAGDHAQAARLRHGPGDLRRRHDRARDAGAGRHAAARCDELVGAGAARPVVGHPRRGRVERRGARSELRERAGTRHW